MHHFQLLVLFFFGALSAKLAAQIPEPCQATRQKCPINTVKFCHESVAFDEQNNIYLLRKDYATPYTGTCVSCYPSMSIEEKLNFVEGKRQGVDTSYYRSGCLQSIQSYQIGLQDGPTYIFYDSSNRVQYEIWYQQGQLHGPSIQFNAKALPDTLMYKHYSNGKLDGVQRTYFSNGKIRKISTYKDGLAEGAQITYNAAGLKEVNSASKQARKTAPGIIILTAARLRALKTGRTAKKMAFL